MLVCFGNFHDGCKKAAASLHQILPESWTNCNRSPGKDSKSAVFWPYTSIYVACTIRGWSNIGWWQWQHRAALDVRNSWKCHRDPAAENQCLIIQDLCEAVGISSGMSEGPHWRTGHVLARSQMCLQDPNGCWMQQHVSELQQLAPEDETFRGHNWWWELSLWLRSRDQAAINGRQQAQEGQTVVKQYQEHGDHLLWHQGNCAPRFGPCWPDCEFQLLLWCFVATA